MPAGSGALGRNTTSRGGQRTVKRGRAGVSCATGRAVTCAPSTSLAPAAVSPGLPCGAALGPTPGALPDCSNRRQIPGSCAADSRMRDNPPGLGPIALPCTSTFPWRSARPAGPPARPHASSLSWPQQGVPGSASEIVDGCPAARSPPGPRRARREPGRGLSMMHLTVAPRGRPAVLPGAAAGTGDAGGQCRRGENSGSSGSTTARTPVPRAASASRVPMSRPAPRYDQARNRFLQQHTCP